MASFQRTPLHERHVKLGARVVPFAGWEMPVLYSSIIEEHREVRSRAGVFDVSHMGQLLVDGEDAHDYLQAHLTNDLDRIGAGEAQYTLITNADGGVVDDLIAYRRNGTYLLVVNAANVEPDLAALPEATDASESWAMLAVQGPRALAALETSVKPFTWREDCVLGTECLVAGTGYTGEPGCELMCDPADAPRLWDAIVSRGVRPCGLGARDTLRLEACLPLHGQDLDEGRDPFAAGLGFAVRTEKEFTGAARLREIAATGPAERLVPFVMEDKGIPRAGMRVEQGGTVTSGGFSPMLERGIGLAYVPAEVAEVGRELILDIRKNLRRARIVEKPIYNSKEER